MSRRSAIKFRKVMVLGLDGLDPTLVESMLARGALPNLAALRERGGLSRVATTTPAQTPVAWSTFATGLNPGGHGIFDFLRRDPATYLPDLALNRYEQKNAFTVPKAVNLRQGKPVWACLADAGIPSIVLRCPCTYPPDRLEGRLLAGMGVPDLRGGLGTATFYTTRKGLKAGESEQVITLEADSPGRFETYLVGPRAPREREGVRLPMSLELDPVSGLLSLRITGAHPSRLQLSAGSWSDWVRIKFKLGLLQSVAGMVRFRVMRTEPELELYASPINFDPNEPLFPISHPAQYARDLAEDLGPYYTTGMVEDHAGLSNGRLDEAAFLDQCDEVWDEREAMMLRELERWQSGLFYCLFDTTDRVQHMFWRHREPGHPANNSDRPALPEYARTIEEQYQRADAAVGAALPYADAETLVIVLSDHGFGSFQRCVDLNAWLFEHELLALKPGLEPGHSAGDLLQGIDWSRTSAYAVGLGGIYLNLQGREAGGIVRPDEAESIKARIAAALGGLADPARGVTAVRSVVTREAAYKGPQVQHAPDLLVQTSAGYRAAWASSMGGVGEAVFTDNTNPWSGDHIVDPLLVPGVLLMSHAFRDAGASLADLAPTILHALGVPPEPAMEGSSLLR